jgi:hypothetical protein
VVPIEQLLPPFVQSWRAVTTYVLRDTFDTAGIMVTAPQRSFNGDLMIGNHDVSQFFADMSE